MIHVHVHALKIPEAETVDKPEMNKYNQINVCVVSLSPTPPLFPSLPPLTFPLTLSPSLSPLPVF